jgi:hypothetical protein
MQIFHTSEETGKVDFSAKHGIWESWEFYKSWEFWETQNSGNSEKCGSLRFFKKSIMWEFHGFTLFEKNRVLSLKILPEF